MMRFMLLTTLMGAGRGTLLALGAWVGGGPFDGGSALIIGMFSVFGAVLGVSGG